MLKDQQAWFNGDGMGRYNKFNPKASVDDVTNSVTLHCDLHLLLDKHAFIFCPSETSLDIRASEEKDECDVDEQWLMTVDGLSVCWLWAILCDLQSHSLQARNRLRTATPTLM